MADSTLCYGWTATWLFDPDIAERLWADLDEGRDYVTALCFTRRKPTAPTICKSIVWDDSGDVIRHDAEPYFEYPRDSVFEIGGSGLAACMMRTEIVKDVAAAVRHPPFDPMPGLGEDYSFCWRLSQLGVKLWCDSRIKVGHIGQTIFDEETYLKQIKEAEESERQTE